MIIFLIYMVLEYMLPIAVTVSSIIMLYSIFKVGRELSPKEPHISYIKEKEGYLARLKELEYRRDMVRNAILQVIKEFEKGGIDSSTKDSLIMKFKGELDKIESEINSISKYAELERLEKEYRKIIKEYEDKRRELEKKIDSIRKQIGAKPEEETKPKETKTEEKEVKEEYTLEDLINEINKIMKEFEEE